MHDTILHRDKMAVVGIHILLRGPAELTVVDDIIAAVLRAKRILGNDIPVHVFAADTETDVSDDEVLRAAAVDFVMRYDDTHTRSRLSGDGVVLTVDTQVFD